MVVNHTRILTPSTSPHPSARTPPPSFPHLLPSSFSTAASFYDGMYETYMIVVPILCLALLFLSMMAFKVAKTYIMKVIAREHLERKSGSRDSVAVRINPWSFIGVYVPQGCQGFTTLLKYGFYWILLFVGVVCAVLVVVASWFAYQLLPYDWDGVPTATSGKEERPAQLFRGVLNMMQYGLLVLLAGRVWIGSYDVSEAVKSSCCCCCSGSRGEDDNEVPANDEVKEEGNDDRQNSSSRFAKEKHLSDVVLRRKQRKVRYGWGLFVFSIAFFVGAFAFLKQALEPASIDECRYCSETDSLESVVCYQGQYGRGDDSVEKMVKNMLYAAQFVIFNLPLLALVIGLCRRKGYMYDKVAAASKAWVPWVALVIVLGYVATVVVAEGDLPLFFLPLMFVVVVVSAGSGPPLYWIPGPCTCTLFCCRSLSLWLQSMFRNTNEYH